MIYERMTLVVLITSDPLNPCSRNGRPRLDLANPFCRPNIVPGPAAAIAASGVGARGRGSPRRWLALAGFTNNVRLDANRFLQADDEDVQCAIPILHLRVVKDLARLQPPQEQVVGRHPAFAILGARLCLRDDFGNGLVKRRFQRVDGGRCIVRWTDTLNRLNQRAYRFAILFVREENRVGLS